MGTINDPARNKVSIPNEYFDDDGQTEFVIIRKSDSDTLSHNKPNFKVEGIVFGSNSEGDDDTLFGQIYGVLEDEADGHAEVWRLAPGVVHPLVFRKIFINERTTARGIRIVGN